MSIDLTKTIDPSHGEFFNYLVGSNTSELLIEPAKLEGYASKSSRYAGQKSTPIKFSALQTWRMAVDGETFGDKQFIVLLEQDVIIDCTAHLLLKNGIGELSAGIILQKFNQYDANKDGDPLAWSRANLPATVGDDFYAVTVSFRVEKLGVLKVIDAPVLSYWDELVASDFRRINHKYAGNDEQPLLNSNKHIQRTDLGYSELPASGTLPLQKNVAEVAEDAINIGAVVSDILDIVIPIECGLMKSKEDMFARMTGIPEIKVTTGSFDVKIGCAVVTIYYPIFKIRSTELQGWYSIQHPENIEKFILKTVETCAIKATLAAAIIGLLFWNPAAAGAAFNEEFKGCVFSTLKSCLGGDIALISVAGPWH